MRSILALAVLLAAAGARPVRRTLNFNMFVLQPDEPDRTLAAAPGISRFGPVLEYLVQRVQGLLSVRVHPDEPDLAANEVDVVTKVPGVVVKPSRTKPGTYEVQMAVLMDDGKPDDVKKLP